MSAAQQVTVPEFLQVREHIASILGNDSQTQKPTRVRQAENLMAAGVIDVAAVLESLRPREIDPAAADELMTEG